jgi:hypothetical protein
MGEMQRKFWPKNLKGEEHLEDLNIDGRINSVFVLL